MVCEGERKIRAHKGLTLTRNRACRQNDFSILTLIAQFECRVNRTKSFSHMTIHIRSHRLRLCVSIQFLNTWDHSQHRQANRALNIKGAFNPVIEKSDCKDKSHPKSDATKEACRQIQNDIRRGRLVCPRRKSFVHNTCIRILKVYLSLFRSHALVECLEKALLDF